ncbi:hypothetical protein BABINDRAFT_161597 [Babjeviella inositovora NRRL Y-12698]|uniref:Purine-cytosine permease n=1 Tax=Babjeviella inositovora NRRL Y-12698 TaxID=984486 RepID=A0A1E3QQH7_9ASCO|nr:uncharacterized protein BABINDRAFT_161597 [Babjeviella inositovora NRRL Y-12698]ODQ79931.1 hypothetical protein BABINDRAFT_161597 [Babjeviella inositovora NRRL Y-12698]
MSEKGEQMPIKVDSNVSHVFESVDESTVPRTSFQNLVHTPGVWGKSLYMIQNIDTLFGIETGGFKRVLPEAREPNVTKQLISVTGLWFSACGGLTSMESFLLGSLLFNLGLKQSMTVGIITQAIGCFVAAYASTMGPKSGLRQIVSTRFVLGWWLVRFGALVNIVGLAGWSIVNAVIGGQILQTVSGDQINLVLGIVLLSVFAFLVAVFGIRYLLKVETIFAIPVFISIILMYVVCSDKYQYASNTNMTSSPSELVGNSLSYAAIGYTVTGSWSGITSDYYVLFPEKTPSSHIFTVTFLGLLIPTTFVAVIGTYIGNIALNYPPWLDEYNINGIGGLINIVFAGRWHGLGKFLVVILFVSLIANSVLNLYSFAFSVQMTISYCGKVPRWMWTFAISAITLICALAGRNKASIILSNMLPMLGYWTSMYMTLLAEENLIFRTKWFHHLYTKENEDRIDREKASGEISAVSYYNWAVWNDRTKVTNGLAAGAAISCGIVGAVLGMDQVYFVGPLAVKAAGDVGIWVSVGMVGVVYPGLRFLELKKFGR